MRIDGRVHFVGDGSNQSGCWLRKNTLLDRIIEPIVKAGRAFFAQVKNWVWI